MAVALGAAPALGVAVALNVLRVAGGTDVAWGAGVATGRGVAVAVDPQATPSTSSVTTRNGNRDLIFTHRRNVILNPPFALA